MNLQLNKLKIAIVYDRVNKFGGAERVLLTLQEMFPEAPLYTSVYDDKKAPWAKVFSKVYTSFLQNIPFAKRHHELFGWLMPLAFESFDFSNYDLVVSVTSEAAKGIITGVNTFHICYMLTPTRYLWSGYKEYFDNKIIKFLSGPVVNYLKLWDKVVAQRPDQIIAISTEVQKRIKKYYDRDSDIVFPPVDLKHDEYDLNIYKKYYLLVSRLVPYKKVDLVVDTFSELNLPLVIVGTGSMENKLKRKSSKNIKYMGNISDKELCKVYLSAKAFIMPQDEDFGITSVEAQSFGTPIIAYKSGGALDTIIEDKTGIFFDYQTKSSLKQAIKKFDTISFNNVYIKENAKKFSKERFKRELQRSLIRTYIGWRGWNKTLAKIRRKDPKAIFKDI